MTRHEGLKVETKVLGPNAKSGEPNTQLEFYPKQGGGDKSSEGAMIAV